MMKSRHIAFLFILCMTASHDLTAVCAQNETISICEAPAPLPRNQPLNNYSPALCFAYGGLNQGTYSLRVFLLETGSFGCASNQWCGEVSNPQAIFTINNSNGANAAGRLTVVRTMDVFDLPAFLWVADLYNQAGVKIVSATQPAGSTALRPPVLNAIGSKTGAAGQPLEFFVTATPPSNATASLSAQNLPTGASFDAATGRFSWPAPVAGTYSNLLFKATLNGNVTLSDAELVTVQIGPGQSQTISLSVASYTTGEGGPAIIVVTRSSSAGTASAQYATANQTATAGADYTATTGTLNFAAGETTKAIAVPINNDAQVEPDETFSFTLSNPTNASLGAPATATVTIADDDTPSVAGQWSGVSNWPVVPIHLHLLPNGKVLFWDRHDDALGWDGTPRLWDPQTGAFTTLTAPNYDLFCSGHSFLADGKLLITGGHIPMPPPNDSGVGENKASLFDSQTNSFTPLPAMNAGRWYPSNVTLASGDVLTLAGTTVNVNTVNPLPQVWQTTSNAWRSLTAAMQGSQPDWADFYPFLYLAPNGRVFSAGPQQTARYLDPAGTGAWTNVAASSQVYRDYGSSVMYDDGKVLIVGGNPREPNPNATPTILPSASAEVINLNAAQPSWRMVSPMAVGRRHHTATLLPDGKALVTGGSALPGFDNPTGAVFFAEQWDPANESWKPMAGYARYRGYHSNALLLADGRVLIAGGGHPDPPGGAAQPNVEIYSPPYLFKGARPTITNAPAQIAYGQTFAVQTPDAASISGVTLIRLGSVTHAFNQNQRINRLSFTTAGGALSVTAPANANLCPPGHYLLFVLNNNGAPSVARVVQIGQVQCTYTIAPASQAFNAASGSGSVMVTTASGCSWTATSNASWINITAGSSGNGNGTVNFTATANTDNNGRVGSLTIAGSSFTVVQAGAGGSCAATPIIPAQTISGTLSANDCRAVVLNGATYADRYSLTGVKDQRVVIDLGASPFDDYLGLLDANGTVLARDDDSGPGTDAQITFTLPANGTYIIEAASLSASTGDYTLTYNATIPGCNYSISPTSQAFQANGGTGSVTVTVTANSGCGWAAASNASWLTITAGNSGSGNGTVNYTVAANNTTSARSGTLAIAGQVFTVTQPACASIALTNQAFNAAGGTGSVAVTAVGGCSWTATSGASWITITAGSSGSGNGTVSYSVAANSDSTSRVGTLTIAGSTFTVVQAGAGGSCAPTPIIPAQTISGTLSANDCPAVVLNGATYADRYSFTGVKDQRVVIDLGASPFDDYLGLLDANGTVLARDDDSGPDTDAQITFTLPANGTYIIEATALSGSTGDYTLTYKATIPGCNYSISPTSRSFQASGGTGSVAVTTPSNCIWASASNASWITITASNSGSGNGTVNYTVAPNTGTTSRTGTLAIAGQIFTVTQGDASNCPIAASITPTNGSAGSAVTITGTKFTGVNAVKFSNNLTAQFTVNSDTQITVTAPSGAVTGPITISKPDCPDAQTGVFTITPRVIRASTISAAPGSTVSLPIELVAQGNENALGFSLTFDPALLGNPQAAPGSDAAGAQFNTNAGQAAQGRFGITVSLPAPQTFTAGVRQIAVVTFTIAANATAPSAAVGFGDQPVVREVSDVSANILPAGYAPGAVTITPGYEADVAPRPAGNNNGTVTITDAVLIGRFVTGLDTAALGSEFQRADCAPRASLGDGRLSVADWTQAGRYAAGLDPIVPAGGPSAPVSFSLSGQGAVASGQRQRAAEGEQASGVRLAVDNYPSARSRAVTVVLDALGHEQALGFSLRFNPAQWRFVSAVAGLDAREATLHVNANEAAQGRIGVALALPAGRGFNAGARQLVVLRFTAIAEIDAPPFALSFGDGPVAREMVDVEAHALIARFAADAGALVNVSAASFNAEALARAQIVAAFGGNLAAQTESATTLPLPTELAGARVLITDSQGVERVAPLFFVSPTQINYQIPPDAALGPATITVTSGDRIVAAGLLEITDVAPGLFTANTDGQGAAAAVALRAHADGSRQFEPVTRFDAEQNRFVPLPIDLGESEQVFLIVYGTGLRGHDGLPKVAATIGGVRAEVLYAGAQGEFTGLDQINLRLPRALAGRGEVGLVLNGDGKATNTVRINIR